MEFYVSGQSLKMYSPVIAADSLNYLTARVNFADESWDGASRWLHFRKKAEGGDIIYDMALDGDNCISAEQSLCLSFGQWEVYLSGTRGETRLTTVPVVITVQESGLVDAPLHELPMSVAEQVDYNAKQALQLAQAVKKQAEEGAFDGRDGTSLSPIGHFSELSELVVLVPKPAPGDVYSVGVKHPYDLYVWDGVNLAWCNHGQLQGAPGEKGERGITFIPSISDSGNITWTNDGGLENPPMRNIMGPAGRDGDTGPQGPGAFEKAKEAGYTGTEETFYSALTMMPYHNRRHLPDGADPLLLETGNIADKAVTSAKLADGVKTCCFRVGLSAQGWSGGEAPYSQTVSVEELPDDGQAKIYFIPPEDFGLLEDVQEAFSFLYDAQRGEGALSFYAKELPALDFEVSIEVTRV